MKKSCGAVIVAAGSASRMMGIDKTMAPILGVPMIVRTVRAVASSDSIDEILVVTREDLLEKVSAVCGKEPKFSKAIPGGSTRAESVLRGLSSMETELVAIHDGARPFVTPEIIEKAVEAAARCGAAAPAVPVKDTIKIAENGRVIRTPDRGTLFAVQTPQVFDRKKIYMALTQAMERKVPLTDDCSAAEAAGLFVKLTEGSNENIKITTPVDLAFGEAILKWRDRH